MDYKTPPIELDDSMKNIIYAYYSETWVKLLLNSEIKHTTVHNDHRCTGTYHPVSQMQSFDCIYVNWPQNALDLVWIYYQTYYLVIRFCNTVLTKLLIKKHMKAPLVPVSDLLIELIESILSWFFQYVTWKLLTNKYYINVSKVMLRLI